MDGHPSMPTVAAVSCSSVHGFSKPVRDVIQLLAGLGVEGNTHAGVMVKHRSRVAQDPSQLNLRQVHLIHGELLDELIAAGFHVAPGVMGENVTTRGLDLLDLPCGTLLRLGAEAVVEVMGLRMRLGPTHPIVLFSGEPPYFLQRVSYVTDLAYTGRFDANPMHVP